LPLRTKFERAVAQEGLVDPVQVQVERLFYEARNDVYYYILSFGLAAHEAQEIAQDVFLRFYAALKGGEDIENPRGWVFRVAHNLALNEAKKSANRRLCALEPLGSKAGTAGNPEQELIRQETAGRVQRALATLSPQQRLCLQLRAEGLRYAEIARVVGVGTSTVGEFLSRAIKKLRKAVHE
jgi:RNA polymerase sigma-70 factor, ECF subfamily